MQERHISFEQSTDVMAFRVITDTTEPTATARSGVMHQPLARWCRAGSRITFPRPSATAIPAPSTPPSSTADQRPDRECSCVPRD
ncbi:MAG: hypothetical protein U5M50_15375 [Sphingobium sp.]|nr:hypothetical protein [Sphingobium sp.]